VAQGPKGGENISVPVKCGVAIEIERGKEEGGRPGRVTTQMICDDRCNQSQKGGGEEKKGGE